MSTRSSSANSASLCIGFSSTPAIARRAMLALIDRGSAVETHLP
jgi:hypothetical protein